MGTIGAIATVAAETLKLIHEYVNDPVRRLEAMQKYIDMLKKQLKGILNETDMQELDKLLIDFIDAIHRL